MLTLNTLSHVKSTTHKIAIMTFSGFMARLSAQGPEPASAAVIVTAAFESPELSRTLQSFLSGLETYQVGFDIGMADSMTTFQAANQKRVCKICDLSHKKMQQVKVVIS